MEADGDHWVRDSASKGRGRLNPSHFGLRLWGRDVWLTRHERSLAVDGGVDGGSGHEAGQSECGTRLWLGDQTETQNGTRGGKGPTDVRLRDTRWQSSC